MSFRVAAVVGSTVLASTLLASAASLTVTASPLQVFTYDVTYEPPADPLPFQVEVLLMAGMSRQVIGSTVLGPYTVSEGDHYTVGYEGQLRLCPADVTTTNQQVPGPFTATSGVAHVLCVQHGEAKSNSVFVWVGGSEQRMVLPAGTVPGSSSNRAGGGAVVDEEAATGGAMELAPLMSEDDDLQRPPLDDPNGEHSPERVSP